MLKYAAGLVLILWFFSLIAGCSTVVTPPQLQQGVEGPKQCPERKLVANVWSYQLLPHPIQERVVELKKIAESRNTHNATDPDGYRGGAVSRDVGPTLRREIKERAPISLDLRVYYLDPQSAIVARSLGVIRVEAGTGNILLLGDPREWIVETIWPEYFLSPISSGGQRRLWLFPEEWKMDCEMNVHGIVP